MTIGEDAEFAMLVERQWRIVFRVAYSVLLNSHDAEDAVQETFLKLYRNRTWRKIDNERAFLARAGWRVAVDRKSTRLRASLSGAIESSAELRDVQSFEISPEEAAILIHDHTFIHSMIDTLPEELRVPLVLSSDEELNSREIGRILGISEGTARTRLQRARQLLRQKIAAYSSQLRNRHKVGVKNV